ncbi:hypothetical protein GQR58_003293 [Nymphon striatum]|nr:hypothetical protein GQR58_003293 [Nymphon striatum]
MGILNWFKLDTSKVDETTFDDTVFAEGTYVSTQELIKLQAQARKLNLSQRTFARASTTGSHHSRFRGRGMDYQESRIYQAGDDIRSMDWRVTARAGKPHTKLYQEERERPVVLLIDLNPSMFFGSKKVLKSVMAAQTAALLGWASANRGDRIGALMINAKNGTQPSSGSQVATDQGHKELPPKMGKRGALQLISELVKQTDPRQAFNHSANSLISPDVSNNDQNTNCKLNEELKRLNRIARPGSLVFIISDFYEINEETSNHLLRLSRHNDLVAVQVVDPLELEAPPAGRYGVTDGKQTGMLNTKSKKGQTSYNDYFRKHHLAVSELMKKRGIPLIQISTVDNPALVLQQHFGTGHQRISNKSCTSSKSSASAPSAYQRQKRKIKQQRLAIFEALKPIENKLLNKKDDADINKDIGNLNILLRQLALMHYPQNKIASLSGKQWLAFLDQSGATQQFSDGPGRVLADTPYLAEAKQISNSEAKALIKLVKNWIHNAEIIS